MDNEKDVFETSFEEKETVDAEVIDENEYPKNEGFDPNAILGTFMQNPDTELRNVVIKLSTLSTTTKLTAISLLVSLLVKFAVYVAILLFAYSLYCGIYVLLHYNKVKENEHLIKDVMSKGDESVDLKKTVWKNIIILLVLIPVIAVSFWYWHFINIA